MDVHWEHVESCIFSKPGYKGKNTDAFYYLTPSVACVSFDDNIKYHIKIGWPPDSSNYADWINRFCWWNGNGEFPREEVAIYQPVSYYNIHRLKNIGTPEPKYNQNEWNNWIRMSKDTAVQKK